MINALSTLKGKYENKKIYIWDINRDSINVFTKVAFRRIDIAGFVTTQTEYVGMVYMNRPIVPVEEVKQDKDYIILASDRVSKEKISMLSEYNIIYWSDSFEINEELKQKKVIVYGIGCGADRLCDTLVKNGIEPDLYCVSKKNSIIQYRGKKVIEAVELENYRDYAIVVSVINARYRSEIIETLSDSQKRPQEIYVELDAIIDSVGQTNLIQSIDLAIKEYKHIYLYSKKDEIAKLVEAALYVYGVQIQGYAYDVEDKEQNIESIYELAYEGVEDKLIIINEGLPEHLVRARENIELTGFSLEKGNYTGLQWYTRAKKSMLLEWREFHDPLVGGSVLYTNKMPGWRVYGKEDEGIRIIVLGGSTSSEEYHPENWVSKLYYGLLKQNVKTVIYNGAHPGNDIVDEILRLLRDASVLQPQIVISMSGLNNLCHKESTSQFNPERMINWVRSLSPDKQYCSGLYSEESLFSFWSRNVRLLKVISEFYGAKFYGFLQPMNLSMSSMTLRESSLFGDEKTSPALEVFRRFADREDCYRNIMPLFEHQNEMYFDICHYTDKAHNIIADKVCSIILSDLRIKD
ncbi:MAG: SGNH/GDSL hydrolase family protein [Mucispirillum sp.]|nr:SGNH/GDSL hydrolase family protein [Mucispirillum sp.]